MRNIDRILKKNKLLLSILKEIHFQYGYLPKNVLKYISKKLNIPIVKIYGTATFYLLFSVKKEGKNVIRVCSSPCCHIKGSLDIIEELKNILKI